MSTPVSTRPLPLIPFLAADGALLLTALLVAWRTSGELTGGSLFAVVFCVGLGAVLAVIPFIFNDVREREAALAERQRQLVDLVNSTTATATRWGTQWAAAATGLEDAAGLATRSLAAAERLPEIFQDKADALTQRLDDASREAATLASSHAAQNEQARAHVAELAAAQVSGTVSRDAALAALAAQDASLASRAEQLAAHTTALEQTSAGLGRFEVSLRDQHAALAVTLAEFPRVAEAAANTVAQSAEAASARAQAERAALDARLASVPAELEAQLATKLSAQLDTQVAAASAKLGETFAGFDRIETALRDQHAALSATLAEFPAAAARAQAAQASLDQRANSAPAEIAASVTSQVEQAAASVAAHVERATERATQDIARITTDAETRLTATTEALNNRLAVLESSLAAVAEQLERVKQWEIPVIASGVCVAEAVAVPVAEVKVAAAVQPQAALELAAESVAPEPVSIAPAVVVEEPAVVAAFAAVQPEPTSAPAKIEPVVVAKPEKPSVETIMDPFYIPDNGYSALAAAMDGGKG